MPKLTEENKSIAVDNFRKYLRIPSVHPDVNYNDCVQFLKQQAQDLDLPFAIYGKPNKPIVILTWVGTEPKLPSILLNSHMDVVPVYEDKWTHGPFNAEMDQNGNIYARGSQDMKCVGIQYLEAIRYMKQANIKLKRTLHISFVPDEEVGGAEGMKIFVKTASFRNLNVGFALDEGAACPDENFFVFYGERTIWHIEIHCPGTTGHGSLLHDNTAGEKIRNVLNKFMDYRDKEKKRLEANKNLMVGDVTTINLTTIEGGVQPNVVPALLTLGFDVRIAVDVDCEEFEAMVKKWCQEAGKDIWYTFSQKEPYVKPTAIDDTNPWWVAFSNIMNNMKLKIRTHIFNGGTDSRFLRGLGIPAIGFSPINKTPILLHDNDEYLNVNVFLRGIEIYIEIIQNLANI